MATSPACRQSPPSDFPVRQLFILSLCRICEPIAICSVYPYIYYMIDSFGIAKSPDEIAFYAGILVSIFPLAEFVSGMWWGKLSDKIGRKPVLIGGLIGTMVCMITFGFAKSFPIALLARALGGLLNGNMGVIQTTLAEMVPQKEHQPRAFSILPFVWSVGSIIGPAVGGALADPIRHYPEIFKPGGFLEEYPYVLPNLLVSAVLTLGVLITILFLEETHAKLKQKRDYGLDLGEKLTGLFTSMIYKNVEVPENTRKLLAGNAQGSETEYHTFSDPSPTPIPATVGDEPIPPSKPPSVQKTFTPQIIHLTISYGLLALHTIGWVGLWPVFLSTPRADKPPSSIFEFIGGLGLRAPEVGLILSVQGVWAMFIQFVLFPPLVGRFGAFNVYRVATLLFPIPYIFVPYLNFVPTDYRYASIYIPVTIWIFFSALSYPCNLLLLNNSAPSSLQLGAINGFAASIASLFRGFGPILSGMIYSYGLKIGYVGLAWWANAVVCIISAVQVFWIFNPSEKMDPVSDGTGVDEGESMG